uniref:Uncharacterized protein n=1 Tax=Globodera rostochiensis TaxID=31243 RepID=A0A914I3K7_GLORO
MSPTIFFAILFLTLATSNAFPGQSFMKCAFGQIEPSCSTAGEFCFKRSPYGGAQNILLDEFYVSYFTAETEQIRQTFMSKIAIYTHIYMLRWKLDQNKEQLQQKVLEKENKYISFYQQHSDNLSKILTLFAEMALYDDALCFLLREWMLSDLLNFIDQRHKLLKYFEMISKSNIRAVNKLRELFIMLVGGSRVALLCNIKELSFICAAPFTPYALMYSDYFQNKKSEIGKWRSKMVLEFSLYNKWGTNFFKKQYVKIRSEAADKCKYIADCVQVQTNFLTIMFKWWVSYSEIFWYNEKKIRAKIVDTLKKTRAKVNLLKEMITKADEHEPALQYAVETGDEKGEVRSFLP